MTKASDYVRQALELLPRAQYGPQMEARIYYHVSSIYREKRKYGRAKYWIKRSKQLLEGVEPGEDTAKAFYNEGRLYMKILTTSPRHDQCRSLALQAFRNVRSLAICYNSIWLYLCIRIALIYYSCLLCDVVVPVR